MKRAELRDDDGRVVATYLPYPDVVDLIEVPEGVALADAATALERAFPGERAAGSEPLGRLLLARGAAPRRHSHAHARVLATDPAPAEWGDLAAPPGGRWARADRTAEALLPAQRAAYPPGHPDHVAHGLDGLARLLSGEEQLGPLRPSGSAAMVDERDAVVAVLLVCDEPHAGPWVGELFRDPDARWRGAGRVLLQRALARLTATGARSLSLVVTDGNPARDLYVSLGFRPMFSSISVVLPGAAQ